MRRLLVGALQLLVGCERETPPQAPDQTGAPPAAATQREAAAFSPCALADAFDVFLPGRAAEQQELLSLFELRGLVDSCAPEPALRRRDAAGDEDAYCVVAVQAAACDHPELGARLRERVERFPQSIGAWLAMAEYRFRPLVPDPDSGLPYNEDIAPEERRRMADAVLEAVRNAEAIDGDDRRIFALRAAAAWQRSMTWRVVMSPETPAEELEAIRARQDLLEAWRAEYRRCMLDGEARCPEAPISQAEAQADRARATELEALQ